MRIRLLKENLTGIDTVDDPLRLDIFPSPSSFTLLFCLVLLYNERSVDNDVRY